jgi:hypothetical protein
MSLRSVSKLLVSLSMLVCASLFAAPLVVDVSGIQSTTTFFNVENTVLNIDVGANSTITSFAYSIDLTAFAPSLLSEIGLAVSDSSVNRGFFFNPGLSDGRSGTGSYADTFDLAALGLAFQVGADGILRLEFYDDVDNLAGADGQWNFGTLTFGVEPAAGPDEPGEVPEPASVLLLAAGLGALGFATRRRGPASRS